MRSAEAAKLAGMPWVGTMSFDTAGRTMMGVTSAAMAELVEKLPEPPLAFGANCGVGASDLMRTVMGFIATGTTRPVVAKGNAGIPKYHDGHIHYDGTPELMAEYGKELGFTVSVADALGQGDTKFSSTGVREALRDGYPEQAAFILGRPFAIEGAVERGRQLGRTLGFPTANVALTDYVIPKLGVYATRTRLPDGREIAGVANIGVNPTVAGEIAPRLEVWLFDFDEDIYDQVIETDLIAFLRPEEKFDSLETMTAQVMADAAQARALLLPEF